MERCPPEQSDRGAEPRQLGGRPPVGKALVPFRRIFPERLRGFLL